MPHEHLLIDEVPKFLASIPSKNIHVIQIINPVDATHLIIVLLQLKGVTSSFNVRKPTQIEYEDQNILKIALLVEAPPWDLLSPEFSKQEQGMLDYRGWFVSPCFSNGTIMYQLCHVICL